MTKPNQAWNKYLRWLDEMTWIEPSVEAMEPRLEPNGKSNHKVHQYHSLLDYGFGEAYFPNQAFWIPTDASSTNLPMYKSPLGLWWLRQSLKKLQRYIIISPRIRVSKTSEDYLDSTLLILYFHHQEIRVLQPICFDENPIHTFEMIPYANPSSTSQDFWIYGDPLMEWMMHKSELLMYAIDSQVKWLDGKMKKVEGKFWCTTAAPI